MYFRLQVIDNGRIKEFDEPLFLLEEKKDSAFAGMVQSLGEDEGKRLIEACRQKRYWVEDKKLPTSSPSLHSDVDGLRHRSPSPSLSHRSNDSRPKQYQRQISPLAYVATEVFDSPLVPRVYGEITVPETIV